MKNLIKKVVIFVIIVGVIGMVGVFLISVEVDNSVLPTNVYEDDGDFTTIINNHVYNLLFNSNQETEYTFVEDIVNYVILNTIKENVNELYDPLDVNGDESTQYIVYDENYYIEFIWAEMIEDQLVVHVSLGSEKWISVNTVIDFYFDYETTILDFSLTLTLDKIMLKDFNVTTDQLDKYLTDDIKADIEDKISDGSLDLSDYSYRIEYSSLIPFF